MPKDDIERGYDIAMGWCIDAMYSLRRFAGNEAIEAMKEGIRAVEQAQRDAARRRRQEVRIPALAPPMSPDGF